MSVNIFGSLSNFNPFAKQNSKFISLTKNLQTKLDKAGDNMTGDLNMGNNKVISMAIPDNDKVLINKVYVDSKFITLTKNLDLKLDKNITEDLNMNGHKICNLEDPRTNTDAANKKYVDSEIRKAVILSNIGLIPQLKSNNDSSDYIVTASSELKYDNMNNLAFQVFNPGKTSQWRVSDNTTPFWIQIKCPKPVMVYRFSIRAAGETKFVKWKIQGNTDGFDTFKDLPFDTQPVDFRTRHFEIDPKLAKEYSIYRIFVEKAAGDKPGLSYWQLYTVNPVLIL